jgi:hypothetical protein
MKITKSELREIIEEELGRLNEMDPDFPGFKEIEFKDLTDYSKKLARSVSEIVKPGHTPDILYSYGQPVFLFMNPVRLNTASLNELSKLVRKVVIKGRYTYIVMPQDDRSDIRGSAPKK